jgi:hypothetical protein
MKSLLISLCLLLISSAAVAEQKQQLGPWDVHYMLMPTTMLDADIARQYQLNRSRNYQLLNISVLTRDSQQPQQVDISGTAVNLAGQRQTLTFRPIKESNALYYLAGVEVRSEQKMSIEVTIRQGDTQQTLKFSQDVYPE